jgi:cytochrome c oxidase assembly factor 3
MTTAQCLTLADTYTISAISQDEFDDVIVPDAPRQPTQPGQLSGGTTVAVQQAVDARK